MGYKALYREYRPNTFDEVVGQEHIVTTLQNAIKNDRLAHAYLFCGPRGTGKTTIAKLLAKAVNCINDGNKPCGVCEHCKSIADGTYPDVIEIDAASNNNVDEVRSLIEKVRYAPLEGKFKVYIIDEVHMMTSSAFNALLKTLEEPPAHVIFILATTEVHKVLPTIVSRCQRFDFTKISEDDLVSKIKEILYKENITAEPGVPGLIASLADGGCRDALGILDQTIAYSGSNLTEKGVRDVFGILSNDEIIDFLDTVNSSKVLNALHNLDEFDKRGIDLVRFTNTLIDCLKDLIIFNKTDNSKVAKVLNNSELVKLSTIFNSSKAFEYIDILMDAQLNFRKVSSIKQYFELIILKLCDVKGYEDAVKKSIVKEEIIEQNNTKQAIEEEIKIEETVEKEDKNSQIEQIIEEKVSISEENHIDIPSEPVSEPIKDELNDKTEEIVEEPINEEIKTIEKPQITPINIENVVITEELLVNFMCHCDKVSKISILNIWPTVAKYVQFPQYEEAARALRDTSVIAAGNNCMIITADYDYQANNINSYNLYFKCRELLKAIFDNKTYFVVATTMNQFNKAVVLYKDRKRTDSLPIDPILKDFYSENDVKLVEEDKINSDENVEKGKELFGNLFEVKK